MAHVACIRQTLALISSLVHSHIDQLSADPPPAHEPVPRLCLRRFWLALILLCLTLSGVQAQTLTVTDDIQSFSVLTSTAATLSGKAELRLTGTGDVLPGSTVNLASSDAWLIFTEIPPSTVQSTFLNRIRVSGSAAVLDSNVRIVQFGSGAVVIPHAPSFQPLQVYAGRYFRGSMWPLNQYTAYNAALLGAAASNIGSFKLKRGYMATFATSENGVENSRCYLAQDGDMEVSRLPAALEDSIVYVRVFPWRWVSKKGIAGNIASAVKAHWYYNWNLDQNSTLDREYAAIRQTQWWPSLSQNWQSREITHVLGYNEPDNAAEANLAVGTAISNWPDVLAPGLRVGSPAPTDGGLSWLYSFVDQADADGLRLDYVAVHYYRSYWNNNDPAAITSQFYNFLKGVYDRTKRPIWVTEWNNGANWTGDPDPTESQQANAVEAMIEMLDNTPFVERYALYNWVEDARRLVWDDGWPRAAGVIYRDKVSPTGHRQERQDSGVARTTRYRFDGGTEDSGGNGQDAIRVGTPGFATGKYGQAISLDGVNDYLQLPSNVGDSTDFTFSAWIYWNGGAGWQRIFDLGDLTSNYLFLTPKAGSAGGTRFAISTGGGASEQRLEAAALSPSVWTHVAVTLSSNTGKLFINGALVDTNTSMTLNPDGIGVKYNYLGHSRFPADPNFSGRMDDVRFLTSALTDAQVAALATTAPPQFPASSIAGENAPIYQPYSYALAPLVTGGVGALTFAKMEGPAWLKISSAGVVTGTPAAADAGLNKAVVRVTDSANGTHMVELTVNALGSTATPVTISSTVASSSSDAEEAADGTINLTSTDLELVNDSASGAGDQTIGLRFAVQVPPGALIKDARIQFTADEDQTEPTVLAISSEAADHAAAFTTTALNLSGRSMNPVTVPWTPGPWTAGSAGIEQRTPNLAGLVQLVVTRPAWTMGNSLAFFITGSGHRTAEAHDKSGGTPAVLEITYIAPSPLLTATATISASANDAEQSAAGAMTLDSTDLELVADGAQGNQTIGLRFAGVAVPRDAWVDYAAIQFAADEAQSTTTSLTFHGQSSDNAPIFTTASGDLTNRVRTSASVQWSPEAWATIGERSPRQLTPDLSPIVQEIVSRPGWASNNAMALLVSGTGHRTADSFDDTSGQPAQLAIHYYSEVPLFSYERWTVDHPGANGPTDDDDGDGLPNLAEYALGGNPVAKDALPHPLLQMAPGYFLYTYHVASAALEVDYQVEWADQLEGPWSSAGIITQITADDGTLRSERAAIPLGPGRRFARLKFMPK